MPSAEVSTRQAVGTPEELHLNLRSEHLAELRQLLRRHVPGIQVWAYGSRVTGGAHGGSDLDLVLRQPADLSRRSAGLPELREARWTNARPGLPSATNASRSEPELPASFHREIERGHVVIEPGR